MSTEGLPPTFPGSPPGPPPPAPKLERLLQPGDVGPHDYARALLQVGVAMYGRRTWRPSEVPR